MANNGLKVTAGETPPAAVTMFSAIQQPAAMSEEGNLSCNWREWKSAFDYYLVASGKENAQPREKSALFLHVIGKYGREILEELDITEETKTNYEALVSTFAKHCDPARNVNYERHIFFETFQREDGFDKFLSSLKIKSKSCEFGELRSSLILTQLIRGLKEPVMRERLLSKQNLSLEEAVMWCRAAESAGRQAEACSGSSGQAGARALEEVGRAPVTARAPWLRGRSAVRGGRGARGAWFARSAPPQRQRDDDACANCGRRHGASGRCWARNVKCYRCDSVGHFAKLCRSRYVGEALESYHEEDCGQEDYDESELILSGLQLDAVDDGGSEPWYETVLVDEVSVKFKLDSGADASVISLQAFKEAGFQTSILKKDKIVLREISKAKLPVVGYFEPVLSYKSCTTKQKVYVLNVRCNNLLGLNACKQLRLIGRICEVSRIAIDESVFDGIGCLPSISKITIDESVPPVVNASRKIPIKMQPRLQEELDNMEKLNIIVKEESPTDWVSNIVIVEKSKERIRICLDPFHLNKAVRRCHFPLPTLDEITSSLSGARYFSKLDAKNGFWMLQLDDASSKLTTFATPFGRYRFLRMPFGINCAPEIFHHEMYKIFSMPGVEVYSDDVLVWGTTMAEHDSRLEEVIRRAQKNGVKFNKEKCIFGAEEVNFLGHVFSKHGIRPDAQRVDAVIKIPKPNDKKELERFLGITNYLSRFIPDYSNTSSPLRELLKRNVQFDWCGVHDLAFEQLKTLISAAPVLRYYDPQEPVTLSVDASGVGLGAVMLQGGQPVAYAARTLTPTERRWAQIEKELLAILFGCVRFHQYVYGHSHVTVESDHKPLEAIFKKSLNETPARLQRMMLKLQSYCLKIIFTPGKLMFIADALSRAAVDRGEDNEVSDDVTIHVNAMYHSLNATPEKLNQIKIETNKDSILPCVINYYHNGWPREKKNVRTEARAFWSFKEDLHVVNGILFRNDKIVIPLSLRKEMLERVHEGHLGIEKSKRRARETIWWPGMGAEVEQAVARCEPCARHRAAPPREPLAPHAMPALPWEVLAADIFELKRVHYLLVVDYYSKFVEVATLPNLLSATVIVKLKNMFSRFGIPARIVTDNGTQFTSAEFKKFATHWEFSHVTSSPLYPRSNGLAERNVQTVKRLLTKASEDGTEWQLALLNFRNTPITGEQHSPAQLLMSRSLNTRLPVSQQALVPRTADACQVRNVRMDRIDRMKRYYDRGTRALEPLLPGEQVRVRDGSLWIKARILNVLGDRTYLLKVDNGSTIRRNRSHILKLPNLIVSDTSRGQNRYEPLSPDHWESDLLIGAPMVGPTAAPVPVTAPAPGPVPPRPPAPYVTRSGRVVRCPDRYGVNY